MASASLWKSQRLTYRASPRLNSRIPRSWYCALLQALSQRAVLQSHLTARHVQRCSLHRDVGGAAGAAPQVVAYDNDRGTDRHYDTWSVRVRDDCPLQSRTSAGGPSGRRAIGLRCWRVGNGLGDSTFFQPVKGSDTCASPPSANVGPCQGGDAADPFAPRRTARAYLGGTIDGGRHVVDRRVNLAHPKVCAALT